MKHTDNKCSNKKAKAALQSWDTPVGEGLGDNAEYHQPRQFREQTHLGSLKIKQTEGETSQKAKTLSVKNVTEREQQRIAG